MKLFAVVKDNVVVNKIICDSKDIAEEIVGMSCIEIENELVCSINSAYIDNEFTDPAPYPSWTYDQESGEWIAPVPMPDDANIYSWSEENLNWIIVTE
jgi:hypothetical protein